MVVAGKKEEIEKKDDIDAATTVNMIHASFFIRVGLSPYVHVIMKQALRELEKREDCCLF